MALPAGRQVAKLVRFDTPGGRGGEAGERSGGQVQVDGLLEEGGELCEGALQGGRAGGASLAG